MGRKGRQPKANQRRKSGPSKSKSKRKPHSEHKKSLAKKGKLRRRRRPESGESDREKKSFKKKFKSHNIETRQGEVQKNHRGFAFLLQEGEDVFIPAAYAGNLVTGDVVKIWVNTRKDEVIKLQILKRILKSFIGTFTVGRRDPYVLLEDRNSQQEVLIRTVNVEPFPKENDKVQVEITKYEPRLEGIVVRNFGDKLAPKFDTLAVVLRSQWPQEFDEKSLKEAEKLSIEIQKSAAANNYKGRKDLRDKPFVTIDGADARDFDDAVLVEKTNAGFVLYVAIADVSEFVQPNTKLDEEAYARATSVYFPEWVIPMLPEVLSNGACSLRPDEEKLTLTCEMHYDKRGKLRSSKIYESVIKSHRRCIYEDVDEKWKNGDSFWTAPFELYKLIRAQREKRGSLDFDMPEAKVVLDDSGDTTGIVKADRLDSHRLIEEFMIAANEAVTETMEREGWPFVYRVHEVPNPDKLEMFSAFARALGLEPNLGEGDNPQLVKRFLDQLENHPLESILHYLLLRSLKQAHYSPANKKHFGLASQAYTHFTSPIRRYPDLIVHRILKKYARRQSLAHGQLSDLEDYLAEACAHCSSRERKAEELERTVIRVKKSRFMQKHLGKVFDSTIIRLSDKGITVELNEWFIEGLLPVSELQNDYFVYDERKMLLYGKRTGFKYKLGDQISVAVLRTDLDSGFVDFTLSENL